MGSGPAVLLPRQQSKLARGAKRFATDPEYRASLVAGKVWEKAKGK